MKFLITLVSSLLSAPMDFIHVKNSSKDYPIWFVEDHDSSVVSVQMVFKYAAFEKKHGLVELLSSLIMEGAGDMDNHQFKRFLLEKNIQIRFTTTEDHAYIKFRTLKGSLKDAFHCVYLMINQPRFDAKDIARIKQEIVSYLKQAAHDPGFISSQETKKYTLGENHPYYTSLDQALIQIPALTKADLTDYIREFFTRESFGVTACGDITEDELRTLSQEIYSSLPPQKEKQEYKKRPLLNEGKRFNIQMPVPQTMIQFTHPGIDRKEKDFYALNLAMRAFAGHDFETRLMTEVREKRGLAYFCSGSLISQLLSDRFQGATATKTESVEEVIQIIRDEFQKLKDKGISQDEFEFHKDNIIGSFPLSFTTTSDVASILMYCMTEGFEYDYINKRNQYYNDLTLKQLNEAVKKHIDPIKLTFVTVGRKVK